MSAKVAAALRDIANSVQSVRCGPPTEGDCSDYEAYARSIEEDDSKLRMAEGVLDELARKTSRMTPTELHRLFGAPGNWGYDTPLGKALYEAYQLGQGGES